MRTSCGCGRRFTVQRIPYRPRGEKRSAAQGRWSPLRLEPVVLQPAVERAAGDAQVAGGLADVSRAARERPLDEVALRLVQRHRLVELARVAAHTQERRFAPLASYMAGVFAERLGKAGGPSDPATVASLIRDVREGLERDAPSSRPEERDPSG